MLRTASIVLLVLLAFTGVAAGAISPSDGAGQSPPPTAAVQAPARDARGQGSGTGRLRGRVVAADTGAPVRRASVEVSATGGKRAGSAMTDGEGRYEFVELPAGSYSVLASKTGFLRARAGGTKAGDVGKSVKVESGGVATAEDVTLTRAGTIAGRVVDEFGDPVASVQVRVMRSQSLGQVRRMVAVTYATTNDLGEYRAFDLPPGTYAVVADTTHSGESLHWRPVSDRATYAPTYYPGTASAGEAGSVQVVAGQETAGVDVTLALVPTVRVSGIALDTQGRPASGSTVWMYRPGGAVAPFAATVQPGGTFAIRGVPAGDYVVEMAVWPYRSTAGGGIQTLEDLRAAIDLSSSRHVGRTRASVADQDIEGLTIQTSAGGTLSGQVVFEGAPVPQASRSRLSVMPARVPQSSDSVGPLGAAPEQPARVAADGTFHLTNLFGERVVRVEGLPPGWTLKAVYQNGRETTDTPFAFEGREHVPGVQIVVTDRVTHLAVTVTDDDRPAAARLLVFPEDVTKAGPATRFQTTASVEEGKIANVDALPPGDYIAVALGSAPTDIYDPTVFDAARKVGLRFSLKEGETKQLTLKLVPSLNLQ